MAFIEFEIAKTGLFASQRGLQTTMNNITNATTEGYSRRVLEQKAERPIGNIKTGMMGTGVQTLGIKRMRDSYIDQKIWGNSPALGEYNIKVQQNYLLEAAFNEPSDTGFTTIFNTMFNAISNLSINPSSDVDKTNVKEAMVSFSKYYNNISGTLSKCQQDLNFDIKNTVNEINNLSINIRDLNEQITYAEIYGNEASDFRDERDKCLDRLSELINIEVEENEIETKGHIVKRMTVRAAGQVLVDDKVCNTLEVETRGEEERKINEELKTLKDTIDQTQINESVNKIIGMSKRVQQTTDDEGNVILKFTQRNGKVVTLYNSITKEITSADNGRLNPEDVDGLYDIKWSSGLTFTMSDSNMSGELKGLIDMRDGSGSHGRDVPNQTFNTYNGMPYYINRIDTYVKTFAKTMNEVYGKTDDGRTLIEPYETTSGHLITSITFDKNGEIKDYYCENCKQVLTDLGEYRRNPDGSLVLDANGNPIPAPIYKKDENGNTLYDQNGNPIVDPDALSPQEEKEKFEKEYVPYLLFSYSSGDIEGTPVASRDMDYANLNAGNFSISYELFEDPSSMKTLYDKENPSDTSFMLKLLEQKDNKQMFKEGDPKDYMIAIFAELGINTNEAEMFQATKNAISLNLDNQRKSVSQVDTSEEFVYLIQYQQAYQASARMMTTIDKIYEITINKMGSW